MALCLKDLEERKEQEAGNRRSIEQAANDLKVKCGFLLHWMVIFQGETFCFLCCSKSLVAPLQLQRPRQLLLLRKRVYSLYPSQHITVKGREEERSPKAWPSLSDQPNISGRTMLKFLCRVVVNSPSCICYSGFTDVYCIALNCIIEQSDFRVK